MTELEQAARQALEALDAGQFDKKRYEAGKVLREALEQPAKTLISKEAFDWIDANAPMFVREALDHSADAGNKVSERNCHDHTNHRTGAAD